MKFALVFAAVLAVAFAAPPVVHVPNQEVTVLKYENDNIGVGPYSFAVETSDGQTRSEHATVADAGTENEHLSVHGEYSWVHDGVTYILRYVADKDGFRPEGDHLPKNTEPIH